MSSPSAICRCRRDARLERPGARAAVIGGGLLGIGAAYGLAKAGVKVALVHLMVRLMERQLDARAAILLKRAIEAEGIEVLLGADTNRVSGKIAPPVLNSPTRASLPPISWSARSA